MINFENLDKFMFPGVGAYDIPQIEPVIEYPQGEFISIHHRHHRPTVGCKFCVGVFDDEKMVGCVVCGRPVSRYLDDGLTCEINRLCTDGTRNAC